MILITLATKDTAETVRDAQSCAPSRFENFLRDGGHHLLVYCGKGLDVVATASSRAKSKNAGIGTRTQDLAVRSPESTIMLESGLEPPRASNTTHITTYFDPNARLLFKARATGLS